MRIIIFKCNDIVNTLANAVQLHCQTIAESPDKYQILCLADLDNEINKFINKVSSDYPEYDPEDFCGAVQSFLTFEIYNLMYKTETNVISVTARKTKFVKTFQEYDDARYGATKL